MSGYDNVSDSQRQQLKAMLRSATPRALAAKFLKVLSTMYEPPTSQAFTDPSFLSVNSSNEPFVIQRQDVFLDVTAANSAIVWLPWNGLRSLFYMLQVAQGFSVDVGTGAAGTRSLGGGGTSGTSVSGTTNLTFLRTIYVPSSTRPDVQPSLTDNFNQGRFIGGTLSVQSKAASLNRVATTGVVNYGAIQDIRGLLSVGAASIVSSCIVKKDGRTGIPISEGATTILGSDVRPDYAEVSDFLAYGDDDSAIQRNILSSALAFRVMGVSAGGALSAYQNIDLSTVAGGLIGAYTYGSVTAQPARFTNCVFVSFHCSLDIQVRDSDSPGNQAFQNITLPKDPGFATIPRFRIKMRVPCTSVHKSTEVDTSGNATSIVQNGNSTLRNQSAFATVTIVHLWGIMRLVNGVQTLTVETLREDHIIFNRMANDSLPYTRGFGWVRNPAPGAVTTGYVTDCFYQLSEEEWLCEARRPPTEGAIWLGSLISPQVINPDTLGARAMYNVTDGAVVATAAENPIGGGCPTGRSIGATADLNGFPCFLDIKSSAILAITQIDIIATRIYQTGTIGPARIFTIQNPDPSQSLTLQGTLFSQLVADATLAPFVPSGDSTVNGLQIMEILTSMFGNKDIALIKRNYLGVPNSEGVGEFQQVSDLIRRLTVDDLYEQVGAPTAAGDFVRQLTAAGSPLMSGLKSLWGNISPVVVPTMQSFASKMMPLVEQKVQEGINMGMRAIHDRVNDQLKRIRPDGGDGNPRAGGSWGAEKAGGSWGADKAGGSWGAAGCYDNDDDDDDDDEDDLPQAKASYLAIPGSTKFAPGVDSGPFWRKGGGGWKKIVNGSIVTSLMDGIDNASDATGLLRSPNFSASDVRRSRVWASVLSSPATANYLDLSAKAGLPDKVVGGQLPENARTAAIAGNFVFRDQNNQSFPSVFLPRHVHMFGLPLTPAQVDGYKTYVSGKLADAARDLQIVPFAKQSSEREAWARVKNEVIKNARSEFKENVLGAFGKADPPAIARAYDFMNGQAGVYPPSSMPGAGGHRTFKPDFLPTRLSAFNKIPPPDVPPPPYPARPQGSGRPVPEKWNSDAARVADVEPILTDDPMAIEPRHKKLRGELQQQREAADLVFDPATQAARAPTNIDDYFN